MSENLIDCATMFDVWRCTSQGNLGSMKGPILRIKEVYALVIFPNQLKRVCEGFDEIRREGETYPEAL